METNKWIEKLNIAKIAMENERARDSEKVVFLAMSQKTHHKLVSSNDERVDYYKWLDAFTFNGIPLHINHKLSDTEVRGYKKKCLEPPTALDKLNSLLAQRPITTIPLPDI